MEKPHSFLAKLVNGAIAGVVGVTCTFPLDLCKTRLQDQRNLGAQKHYRNLADCLWKVARAEGVQGLYKGMGINLLLINPEKAIKLAVNDQIRQLYGGRRCRLPLTKEMIAGGAAGFCQVIITTPMEMLKIQLQMAGTQTTTGPRMPNAATAVAAASSNLRTFGTKSGTAPKSAMKIAHDLMRSKGISGIYKGLGATLARDVPFSCIYFPLFAFLRLEFQGEGTQNDNPGPLQCLIAGCTAAMVGSAAVTPMDVVKTRLQVIRSGGEAAYNGLLDCARKTYVNEGIRAFYKGTVPRMIVIAPLFGIAQTVYFLGVAERLLGLEVGGI
ncbi:mitochondrial glutamate carrier 2-like [Orbicella faveolata]|uniref:mitochondrial glutamate carrier 2-like n=1 Tax=Orbicella faveolata TaxID=48498 RepID=UPI0009E55943|nr:mitochondrial glutamate carrier 2-like [Orbicella faveolata]XP_020619313.1 mitochondrial glutamate carrier 2-like [Orbicella faveolata]